LIDFRLSNESFERRCGVRQVASQGVDGAEREEQKGFAARRWLRLGAGRRLLDTGPTH